MVIGQAPYVCRENFELGPAQVTTLPSLVWTVHYAILRIPHSPAHRARRLYLSVYRLVDSLQCTCAVAIGNSPNGKLVNLTLVAAPRSMLNNRTSDVNEPLIYQISECKKISIP